MHDLGYLFGIHDQYRDYYLAAPSFNEEYACRLTDGSFPQHQRWAGGPQSFLCATQAPYYVKRNFAKLEEQQIELDCVRQKPWSYKRFPGKSTLPPRFRRFGLEITAILLQKAETCKGFSELIQSKDHSTSLSLFGSIYWDQHLTFFRITVGMCCYVQLWSPSDSSIPS